MYDFKALYEANSVQEAIRLLDEHPDAVILAGGSDVLIDTRSGKLAGREMISIYGMDELRGVSIDDEDNIRIGSLTSFSAICRHRHDRRQYLQRRDFRGFRFHADGIRCCHGDGRAAGHTPHSDQRVVYQAASGCNGAR